MMRKTVMPRCLCGATHFERVFSYDAPPEGEVRFGFASSERYHREVLRCEECGHFVSIHEMDASGLYSGDYVNSTYGDNGIQHVFKRIISLDPVNSDNFGRVERVIRFASQHISASMVTNHQLSVLDVGSGICVFLHGMKAAGWRCTALDPDPRAAEHARTTVGVRAVCGDFLVVQGLGRFDVITFNKVLEHVSDPVKMLAKALAHVQPGGFVYVEVPDGEMAVIDGPGREEFFIDHWHIFSVASLALLVAKSGFAVRVLERVREPSGKYTLRAFMVPSLSSVKPASDGIFHEPNS